MPDVIIEEIKKELRELCDSLDMTTLNSSELRALLWKLEDKICEIESRQPTVVPF